MKTRRLTCVSVICLLIAMSVGPVGAQEPLTPFERFVQALGRLRRSVVAQRNEFILRAPAHRVAQLASTHRLRVIRRVANQDIYLVEGPENFGSRFSQILDTDIPALQQLVSSVQGERDVQTFEANVAVVTPELASGLNLNQSTGAITSLLADRTIVDYFGAQAWRGYVTQPATTAIGLAASQEAGSTGAGTVAIIDTGVDPNHPLLQSVLVPGYDFVNDIAGTASEWSDVDGSLVSILDGSLVSILDGSLVSILDDASVVVLNGSTVGILDQDTAATLDPSQLPPAFGHGTMVAGIVHLVAPTARIMPLKAFRADGTSTVFDVVEAIHYAVDHGARVINMSFSATAVSPEIAHAINYATSMGVVCVASAGNLGQEVLVYPAALRNVLSVGSTTSTVPPVRSSFSNYGASLVSLGAPGEGVITSYPGGNYAGVWGTSFSAPMAAGAAALLLQADSTLDQAKADILLGHADRIDAAMGRGRLNLDSTVRAVVDSTPPAVGLTAPTDGGVLFGTVGIAASASDNVRVAGVQFLVDEEPLGPEDTAAPYEATWPTAASSNGSHVLKAVARDSRGNKSTSAITVTVSNDLSAPTVALTNPAHGATVNGTLALSATAADDHGVFGVQFKVDGIPLAAEDAAEPFEVLWNTLTASNGLHTLTALARDASGKETAASIVVTVANDATAPVVALTSPAGGSVSGTVTLAATATDDIGIAGVRFLIDGSVLGQEDTSAPYEATWVTSGVGNGEHTLTAVARDAAGRETTASTVVTVANDTTAPAVAITSPVPAAVVAGFVAVLAEASDDGGVAGVQFEVDGAQIGAEDTVAPYELLWDAANSADGEHTLTAVARDTAGNQTTSASVLVTVANDLVPPSVAVTSPTAGSVSGAVAIAATATDNVGVAGVQFLLNGVNFGAEDTTAPYEMVWPTSTAPNGVYTVEAVARDAAGNQAGAVGVVVTVANDATGPTVTMTSPAAGGVSGTVTVAAAATDDVGVAGVQFRLNGANLGAEDTTAPYEVPWPTLSVPNGEHTLTAVARDAAGNQATAASIVVTVVNDTAAPTVTMTNPAAGSLGGTATIAATATDDIGVVGVQFLLDGASLGAEDTAPPYELAWATLTVANGTHTLTAVARDAAGNQTTATNVVVTVANDTTAPTVTMTSPAGGNVSGTVTVAATAADDFGVVGVQFLLDGADLGGEDTTAPYEAVLATLSVANGDHTLTAVARDAAGNQTTATYVVVTVANDTTAPTVTMTSPSAGSVSGTVTVAATAVDDFGVAGVQFLLDGVNLGAEDTTAPYELAWDTLTVANGGHTLTAVARDAAGNQATAAALVVTVANDTTAPTVTLTGPTGEGVSGAVTVSATAADDSAVVGVQFLLDGVNLGAEDTTAPYELAWDTLTVANGVHTLTAVARDAAGNQATAAALVVTVANDTTAPTVTMTSPGAGNLSGTVVVAATAADDIGVAGVQFLLDGVSLDAEDTAAPYEVSWATLTAVNGEHTLTAVARDASGNQTTAASVLVTVANEVTAP
jgi:hypothetical protein